MPICTSGRSCAAAGLRDLGLEGGERLAVFLDKRIETVVALLGCSRAGGVFVPVNPVLRPRQVRHILDDCAVRVLVTSTDRLRVLRAELGACRSLSHVLVLGDPPVEAEDTPLPGPALGGGRRAQSEAVCPTTGGVDTDVAAILYTSGSTGAPKGVVLSHRNLVVGAESVSPYLENTSEDRILAVLPLSFDAGLSQLTTGFCVGAHVVLADYLLPGDVVRLCAENHITGLVGVPPLWIQLAAQTWPSEAVARDALLREHRGATPARHPATRCARSSHRGAVPDVRPDGGVPLHLPRSRRRSTGGPTPSARPSPTPRSSWSGRTAACAVRASRRAGAPRCAGRARGTGTTRTARPSGSGRRRTVRPGCASRSWRSGPATSWSATRRASCSSSDGVTT